MEKNVTLMAIGDLMLGDHPHCIGLGVRSLIDKKNVFVFQSVEHLFLEADIVFGNLETVLSDRGINASYDSMVMRGRPEFIKQLKKARFNILNVANNHIQQHGQAALAETIDVLENSGIKFVGIDRHQPQIISRGGITFGFIGYSLAADQYVRKNNEEPVYSWSGEEQILSAVQNIRDKADHLIVSLHWGDEYVNIPSARQIDFSHRLADSGAGIILGHHSHIFQPVERYKNSFIAYSLGNFVSDMCQEQTKKSAILKISFTKDKIQSADLVPVRINKKYQPEIHRPIGEQDKMEITDSITPLSDGEYRHLVDEGLGRSRMEYLKFLSGNFYRFDPRRLAWIVKSAAARRIAER